VRTLSVAVLLTVFLGLVAFGLIIAVSYSLAISRM
jgi:hypothetical protein